MSDVNWIDPVPMEHKVPYEAERCEMVRAEMSAEFAKESPNWNYLEALNKEFQYWNERQKNIRANSMFGIFNPFASLFGNSDSDEDDE